MANQTSLPKHSTSWNGGSTCQQSQVDHFRFAVSVSVGRVVAVCVNYQTSVIHVKHVKVGSVFSPAEVVLAVTRICGLWCGWTTRACRSERGTRVWCEERRTDGKLEGAAGFDGTSV